MDERVAHYSTRLFLNHTTHLARAGSDAFFDGAIGAGAGDVVARQTGVLAMRAFGVGRDVAEIGVGESGDERRSRR